MGATKQGNHGVGTIEDTAKTMQDGMARALEIPRKLIEAQLSASSEILQFAGRRIQAQAELLGIIGQCSNVEDAAAAQRSFFEKANEQYTAEMAHLMDIAKSNFAKMEAVASSLKSP